MAKRIHLSLEDSICDYLKSKPNASVFVEELVIKYLNDEKNIANMLEEILRTVKGLKVVEITTKEENDDNVFESMDFILRS